MTPKPHSLADLLELMRRLRDPQSGCPWDLKQTFSSLAPYTLEEAYEVVDSIERQDLAGLKGELGDLLLQVVFHSQLASEQGQFTMQDVINTLSEKLIRRHPHVFAGAEFADTAAVNANWEAEKAKERQQKDAAATSVLDDIPLALPALSRAYKIQKRCATVGFDWPTLAPVVDKVREEIDEVLAEVHAPIREPERIADELGDLLFATVNLVRHLKQDPEKVLRQANAKFERRFRGVEEIFAAKGQCLRDVSLDEMELAWQAVKQAEKH